MRLALGMLLCASAVPAFACDGQATSQTVEYCRGVVRDGQPMTQCHTQLNTIWGACQQERAQGRPFPPMAQNSNAAVVYAARNEFGLPTWPELSAAGSGATSDGYWVRERLPHEGQAYSEARNARIPEDQLAAWVHQQPNWRHIVSTYWPGFSPSPARTTPRPDPEDTAGDIPPPPPTKRRGPRVPPTTPTEEGRPDADLRPNGFRVRPNSVPVSPRDRGAMNLAGGDHAGAARHAETLLTADPEDVGALALRARARMLAGDRDGAFSDARKILSLDPKNTDARYILGGAAALETSAAKFGRMKVGLDPMNGDPGAAGSGAKTETGGGGRLGTPEFAAPAPLDGVAAQDPKAVQQGEMWKAALRFANLGDWGNALREATRLISLDPHNPEAWLLRSRISAKMGNWEAVESDARRALALRPDDPAALVMLGRSLVQQGKAVDGLAVLERALQLAPRNALAHFYRGEALEKLGRKKEAVDAYQLAASLDPGLQPLVDDALARLNPGAVVPGGSAGGGRMPPWKRGYRFVVALLGSLFLLKGLHFLVERRLKTQLAVTTRPPMRVEDQHASVTGRDPIAGDVLGGNFKVEREIARGGMGVVYLATDMVLKRPVAIKRLHWEHMRTEDTKRKFLQEAQLAARLKHPNLAQIHSVFGERELHLVFELVDGQTLDALLASKGRLGLKEVRSVVTQVCRALEHAHGHRVIHRDLKPANLMLTRDGVCKVMDFGIAHEARTSSSATLTQAWGTPPYMAPEQEEGFVSPSSDLYALAVVAYELLAGRRPFDGPSQHAAKRTAGFRRLGGEYGLPPEIDRFFERALHPEAALRYTTAVDFRTAFEQLAGTPVAG